MPFRHDRRRRVLADELAQAQDSRPAKEARLTPPERAEVYAAEARRERQPRLVDYVPRRNLTFFLLGLLAVTSIGCLQALFIYRTELAQWLGDQAVASLEIEQPTSIASWLAAAVLAVCAALALMVYSARRWRVDDYHRRYRVWLLAAFVAALFSLNQTTHAMRVGQRLLNAAAEASHVTGETLQCALALSLLLLAALRFWFELRRCRAALIAWLCTIGCFAVATVVGAEWFGAAQPVHTSIVKSSAQLLGVWSLLFTFALYERHVLLEIEGNLPKRVRRDRKAKKKAEGEAAEAEQPVKAKPQLALRTDLEPVSKEKPVPTAAKEAAPPAKPKLQWESSSSQPAQQLSRAERKKLKREMRQQAA